MLRLVQIEIQAALQRGPRRFGLRDDAAALDGKAKLPGEQVFSVLQY